MGMLDKIRMWPAWFALPSLLVAAAVAATIAGYSPLMFDPSLYKPESALASELTNKNPDELEKGKSAGSRIAAGKLEDGTWTGYAVCGEGNPDNWKPYYVSVTIEVADGKVAEISDISGTSSAGDGSAELSWDADENQKYLDLALSGHGGNGVRAQMNSQIAEQGSVSSVDAVSGATYSSTAIYNAYADAIAKAGRSSNPKSTPAEESDNSSKRMGAESDGGVRYADGDWTGYAACGEGNGGGWDPYYVAVTVRVENGVPAGIERVEGSATGDDGDASLSWSAEDNERYLNWAIGGRESETGVRDQINAQLADQGSVSGIDTVSGATFSSEAIYEAYRDALRKSAKAAGSAVDDDGPNENPDRHSDESSERIDADSETASASLADGDWTGYAACGEGNEDDWSPYYVAVTVRVRDGSPRGITAIEGRAKGGEGSAKLAWNAGENQRYLNWAAYGRDAQVGVKSQIEKQLAKQGSVSGVDTVSGATYSSKAVYKAYIDALRKSAEAAGAEPDKVPDDGGVDDHIDSTDDSQTAKAPAKVDTGDDDEVASSTFADGTWTGYAACGQGNDDDWSPYYVAVTIRVANGAPAGVERVEGSATGEDGDTVLSWSSEDNERYLDWAKSGRLRGGVKYAGIVSQIASALASGPALGDIDAVSGATYSSEAIVGAYYAALKKAAAAAGSSYEEPDDTSRDNAAGDADSGSGDDSGSDGPDDGSGDDSGSEGSDNDSGEDDAPALADGDYVGYGLCEDPTYEDDWDPYYVIVTVKVEGGVVSEVSSVKGDANGEVDARYTYETYNATYLNRAINGTAHRAGIPSQIQAKLDARSEVVGIDTISGATFSSHAIIAAFEDALSKIPEAQPGVSACPVGQ